MLAEKPSFNNTLNTDWSIFAVTRNPFWARMWHLSLNFVKRPVASNKEKRMKVLWFHFIIWHVPLSSKTRCSSRRWWRIVYVTMSKACTRLLRRYYRQFDVLSARKYRDWSENLKKKEFNYFYLPLGKAHRTKAAKSIMEDFILYWSLILCSNHFSLETAPSYDKTRFARMQYRAVIINMDFSAINSAPRLHHKRNCEGWTLLSIKGHIIYC